MLAAENATWCIYNLREQPSTMHTTSYTYAELDRPKYMPKGSITTMRQQDWRSSANKAHDKRTAPVTAGTDLQWSLLPD